MTPEHLAAWRKRLKLTQAQAAIELGASLTAFRGWEGGKHAVPGYIALAATAVERDADPKRIVKQLRKMLSTIDVMVDSFERGLSQVEDRGLREFIDIGNRVAENGGLFKTGKKVEDRGNPEAKPAKVKK